MSKQPTIAAQLDAARNAIEAREWRNASELLDAIAERKLSKQQAATHAELEQEFEANAPGSAANMSRQLQKYRGGYQECVTASGNKSLNNGDEVASWLEGKDWAEVCRLADEVLGEEPGFHATKYERLNPGQRRMNSGNRIRAAVKRGDFQVPAAA